MVEAGKIIPSNVISLDKKSQENLNKSRKGQMGPGAKGVKQVTFYLEPVK
jgi:hypothetical protein